MGCAVEGRRHLRLRPHQDTRRRLLDRHAPAHRVRLVARRARLLLHPHGPRRAVPADAGQVGVLPHGLGRQRPPHRAARAELLRRPVRPVAALRRRLHPAREARPEAADPDQSSQLRRALRAARRGGRAGLRGAVAHPRAVGGLEAALHDHRTEGPEGQPARLPAQLRPRRGLPAGGADPVGRHLPDGRRPGRARGQGVRRPLPPGHLPRRRTDPSPSRPPDPS